MSLNPITVADYFVKRSLDETKPLTPMQLLKMVYIAHGWSLGLRKQPLINEHVEAWQYGPVVPSVYQAYKSYGSGGVTEQAGKLSLADVRDYIPLLDRIYEVFHVIGGGSLSTMTHKKGTPWEQMTRDYVRRTLPRGLIIPNKLIQDYYEVLAENGGRMEAA